MVPPDAFLACLHELGIDFITGVPDSSLKSFIACLKDNHPPPQHIIAANEGSAIGLAIGEYFASAQVPLVYLQNSGLGNALNPLLSLADKTVFGVPIILLIGWRGGPEAADEVQHIKQGATTVELLQAVGIPFSVLLEHSYQVQCREALLEAKTQSSPYALVCPRRFFSSFASEKSSPAPYSMTREQAIQVVLRSITDDAVCVATTGKASRELFENCDRTLSGHTGKLYIVGGMGHASQIALGISRRQPQRSVYCIDGDGAVLMHMGCLATAAAFGGRNFCQVVINNGAHESVGGQETLGFSVDFKAIAAACGYKVSTRVDNEVDLEKSLGLFRQHGGPAFVDVRTKCGSRRDLGRPTLTPRANKETLMRDLGAC